jgi:hypothetical protein
MKAIILFILLIILVYKYAKRYSIDSCCPYCKSKKVEEADNKNNSPFRLIYRLLNIKTYSCQSCLHPFHTSKNNTEPKQLNTTI